MDLRSVIGKKFLISDGGFGSQLTARGVKTGNTTINITNSEVVTAIHKDYLNSGSITVTMNTFGADRIHLKDAEYSLEEVIKAAYDNASRAVKETSKDAAILYDMCSCGRLLKPLGDMDFEEAYDIFKEQVVIADKFVDGFIIETMTDLYETKAAILAVKENSDKPLICSVTYTESGTMLTGASPLAVVTMLENLGVDMLGINCSLGPTELLPIVKTVLSNARLPLLVQPNAGLPKFDGVNTYYDISADEFASVIGEMIDMGISGFGGCCGTTPEFIRKSVEESLKHEFCFKPADAVTRVTGTTGLVEIKDRVVRCGERLNPTGKPKMKAALTEGRLTDLVEEGIKQVEAGADVLDVNVGIPGIDEPKTMTELIGLLQEVIDVPLQIDSSNPEALEKACRLYNGIPLINSVNGKGEVMDAVFPIVKKYGGVVIGLCIDERGILSTAEERFEIARRIVDEASKYGIEKHRIIIDSLVLTASAQQKEVMETAKCVSMVTNELKMNTCLGLSNVSFGLPNRPLINKTFLAMTMYAGLKLPILNPNDKELMGTIDAFEVLNYSDVGAESYISKHADDVVIKPGASLTEGSAKTSSINDAGSIFDGKSELYKAIVKGQKKKACDEVKLMSDIKPLDIVSEHLIPALDKVGEDYDKQKIFLPQLMMSAETAKLVFDELKDKITSDSTGEKKGPVIIATVEGDVHDIGKNIVKVVLQSYGFEVIDLGKDVKASVICDACEEIKPVALGLSALMTTTVVYMQKTLDEMRNRNISIPTIVGGAVLTSDIADRIGATYYAKDAMDTVRICEKIQVGK